MAEEDWYGPFAGLNRWHWQAFTGLLGGATFLVAGLIGYDTGMRAEGILDASRWTGEADWITVTIGAGLLIYAYAVFRKARRAASAAGSG